MNEYRKTREKRERMENFLVVVLIFLCGFGSAAFWSM
jgi:hypothetical protein